MSIYSSFKSSQETGVADLRSERHNLDVASVDELLVRLFMDLRKDATHLRRFYHLICDWLPKFTDKQYSSLLEENRLPKLLGVTPSFSREQKCLAFALGNWRYQDVQMKIEEDPSFLKTVFLCKEPMAYFACAQAISRRYDPPLGDPELSQPKLYQASSNLFVMIIKKHLIDNGSILDEFDFAVKQANSEKAWSILDQVEKLEIFLSTQDDYDRTIRVLYQQLRDLFSQYNKGRQGFQKHCQRILDQLDIPFVANRESIVEKYKNGMDVLRQSFDFSRFLKERSEKPSVREFQRFVTQRFADFLNILLDDAFAIVGLPPCHYDIQFLGSAAREEVCPFSDLEIVILVDKEGREVVDYFQLLIEMINLQLHALGETATLLLGFTCMQDKNPAGLRLDLSAGELLIVTPVAMAGRQIRYRDDGIFERSLLKSRTFHTSNNQLFSNYLNEIDNILTLSVKRKLLIDCFQIRYQDYITQQESLSEEKGTINVKKDYVEVLFHLLSDMALFWDIKERNTLDILEEMKIKKIFSTSSVSLLKEAVEFLYLLRLNLHCYYQEQKEEAEFPCDASLSKIYRLTRRDVQLLNRIHWLILQPLYKSVGEILKGQKEIAQVFNECDLIKVSFEYQLNQSFTLPYLACIASAPLPFEEHQRYYLALSRIDQRNDRLRQTYLENVVPDFEAQLSIIPNSKGFRQQTLRDFNHLLVSLKNLTTPHRIPSELEVKIVTASAKEWYLEKENAKKLIDFEGNIKRSYQNSLHRVTPLGMLHFKQKPGHPLMEYAIHSLTSRIGIGFTPPTELVRCEVLMNGKPPKAYPALISQTIIGNTLKALSSPVDWMTLTQEAQRNWTWAFLCSVITKPGDGRLDNYVLTEGGNIFCIDNDISFVEPLVKQGFFEQLHFCSAIFLSVTNAQLRPDVLEEFVHLRAPDILDAWIEDLLEKEKSYIDLFDHKERATFYEEDPDNRFKPSLLLREGTLSAVTIQFESLQRFIADMLRSQHPITPLGLLQGMISLRMHGEGINYLGMKIYKQYMSASSYPMHCRLEQAVGRDMKKSMRTFQSDQVVLGKLPTLKEVEERRRYSLTEAREEFLNLVLHQYPGFISVSSSLGKNFVQGNFSSLDIERQSLILKAYTYSPKESQPESITIQGCQALKKETLVPLLHSGLTYLNLSESPNIQNNDIEIIRKLSPKIQELHLNGLTVTSFSEKTFGFLNYPLKFEKLEALYISNCPKLETIQIDAPSLKLLIASNNPVLKEVISIPIPPKIDLSGCHSMNALELYSKAIESAVRIYGEGSPEVAEASEGLEKYRCEKFYNESLKHQRMQEAQAKKIEAEKEDFWYPLMAFGKQNWANYFGIDIGQEPPLPRDIEKILNQSCPYVPQLKVSDTHFLTLIPKMLGQDPLTLVLVEKLIKHPLRGNSTKYSHFFGRGYQSKSVSQSRWVLMTKFPLKESLGKSFADQKKCIKKPYELPSIIDGVVSTVVHYVANKERLFGNNPLTLIRCKEKRFNSDWQVTFGNFSADGLAIDPYDNDDDYNFVGVCAARYL